MSKKLTDAYFQKGQLRGVGTELVIQSGWELGGPNLNFLIAIGCLEGLLRQSASQRALGSPLN